MPYHTSSIYCVQVSKLSVPPSLSQNQISLSVKESGTTTSSSSPKCAMSCPSKSKVTCKACGSVVASRTAARKAAWTV